MRNGSAHVMLTALSCFMLLLLLQYNDVCWMGASQDWDQVSKLFPTGNMTFAGGLACPVRQS
jgi:hypothetical protein